METETPKKARTTKKAKAETTATAAMNISVYDLKGKEVKTMPLVEAIFSTEVSPRMIAQYMRVYLQNQRQGTVDTKTRTEVVGSTRKIYRQKGTGNARHGARKAPIFVGGGVAFGPHQRDYSLDMNKKQKRKVLFATLTIKAKDSSIIGLVNEAQEMKPKTKDMTILMDALKVVGKKVLFVVPELKKNGLTMSIRNIPNVEIVPVTILNPYMVMNTGKIIFVEDALAVLEKHFSN